MKQSPAGLFPVSAFLNQASQELDGRRVALVEKRGSLLVHGRDLSHIFSAQFEIEDGQVLDHAFLVDALNESGYAALVIPS